MAVGAWLLSYSRWVRFDSVLICCGGGQPGNGATINNWARGSHFRSAPRERRGGLGREESDRVVANSGRLVIKLVGGDSRSRRRIQATLAAC